MLKNFVKLFGGDPLKKTILELFPIVDQINALEAEYEKLSDDALRAKTDEFRARLPHPTPSPLGRGARGEGVEDSKERFRAEQEILSELLPEAFAAVREASKRTIGQRHYDVQLIGGIILHRGQIAEMKTGEGKTLVATLPIYLNALAGHGVHLVTVNDYLARRDARWMGAIYNFLGLSVGVLQMAAVTENGKKAFLVDFERESPHEDQHHLRMVDRVEAYRADITYGTNSEYGFDYLRDNMTMRLEDRVQTRPEQGRGGGHYFAIVDEVDNVLIDEARTPLIISGPASGDLEMYGKMAQVVKQLRPEDYEVNEKDRAISLTEVGEAHVEQILGQPLRDPDRPEDVSPEQARLYGYLEQALRAQHLFKRNKDYLVQGGKVIIVDEFTGRLMPGRRWSDGLHQAVEAKEGVRVEPENVTYATITLQNYFRMYTKLAGMTGTALTEAEEFSKIYNLEVTPIITNLEYQASRPDSPLVEIKTKDENGYPIAYFTRRASPTVEGTGGGGAPLYWRRTDYPDFIYRTLESKTRAIVQEIIRYHVLGRPLLVGTTSVESSERLSNRLRAEPVRRLLQTLLLRHLWLEQNNRMEDGRLIPELEPLYAPLEQLDPSALRQFAKPLGLQSINLEDAANLPRLLEILNLTEADVPRLKTVLQSGVQHQVLNARKHTEESQIIAGAGAFGAVTIATNMAGRGVDIKLGGDLAEEIVADVNRVLRKSGYADPFDMTMEERRAAVQALDPSAYGIYEAEVKYFLKYFEDMERVRALGGLHVIGSERHEARRIDNQLRGRAARQGDPGSSRFYLSMEDDLMRLFGGQQVGALMERMRVDDALPLESRLVGGMIEQSQHRVEGANFDVRKHLLEYDDVLNKQREQIYSQRDRIFVKEDLHDDVREMVEAEVRKRVPPALEDEEGPWKLLAWLDQVQPPFPVDEQIFPSYTLRLLLDEFDSESDPKLAAVKLVERALEAEHAHILRAIQNYTDRATEALEAQMREREDALDTFFEALRDSEEPRKPQELAEDFASAARVPMRLTNEQMRKLANDPEEVEEELRDAVAAQLNVLHASRLAGAVESRLGESLGLDKNHFGKMEWGDLVDSVLRASESLLENRRERLTGENGQIARDIEALSQREPVTDDSGKIRLLMSLSQGVRTGFDAKTHRQTRQVYSRFNYVFLAAQLLADRSADEIIEDVLEHLEEAEQALALVWGQAEAARRGEQAGVRDEMQVRELGRNILNQVHRQLLLQAITEQWVDYLTRVEALRVSIGLEAYAQRDPLVQYKSRASEMFAALVEDIRALVVGRAFAYRPRPVALTLMETAEASAPQAPQQPQPTGGQKKKRKRH